MAKDKEALESSPLSTWARRNGYKGVMGDPEATIKKIGAKKVASYIKQLAESSHNHKTEWMHSEWNANILYVYGVQAIERSADGRWHPLPLVEDERHKSNIMLGLAMRLTSAFLGAQPEWCVVAGGGEDEDTIKARTCDRMLRALYREHKAFVRRLFATLNMIIMGDGFLKIGHNAMGGDVIRKEEPILNALGEPVIDPETGEPAVSSRYAAEGSLEIESVSPFHIHVPPGSKTPLMNDCDWVIEKSPWSLSRIWQYLRYEADPDATHEDPVYELASDFTRGIGARLENYFRDSRSRDEAFVWEYNELAKLQEGFEEGIHIKVVNNDVVVTKPQQLPPKAGYPYVHLPQLTMPNRFWSHSIMTELRPTQRAYNKDRLRLSQNRDLTALPWLWDQFGSGFPQDAFTSGPRRLKGHVKPEWVSPPEMSQALIGDMSEQLMDFDRISNQFGPSRGEMPGKSPIAGSALEQLQTNENQTRQPQLALSSDAWVDFGYKVLELVRKFYEEGRLFALAGPTGRVEGFVVGARDIPLRYQIVIQEDSALSQSKSSLRQELLQAIQMGLYQDAMDSPQKLQWLRDQLRYPTTGDLTPPQMLDTENAVEEWRAFLGEQKKPEVSPLEDHQTHIDNHIRVTKTSGFRRLPDQVKKIWIDHISQTQAIFQAQQAEGQKSGFEQQTMSALLEAVSRGKFRDAEAMLLAMRGIMQRLEMQVQAAGQAAQPSPQKGAPQQAP